MLKLEAISRVKDAQAGDYLPDIVCLRWRLRARYKMVMLETTNQVQDA
jgi:hypothetical protein